MRITIDDVFDQIIAIQIKHINAAALKDIRLDFNAEDEYDLTLSYADAYHYLCSCLLVGPKSSSQTLLDLYLIHQYLCYCYITKDKICHLLSDSDLKADIKIIRNCFYCYRAVGAFQECIEQYEILRESCLWQKMNLADQMQIMKESAKSYRNKGDFYRALNLYNECLTMNPETEWCQRVELLLKIGKVYRNYLMQIELAKFYVEEAYHILESNRDRTLTGEKEKRYAVICFDTLGQIYRDELNFAEAKKFFDMSKKLYGKDGGRAHVHEILMKYLKKDCDTDINLLKDIEILKKVIDDLEQHPGDEIGIGIRSVQLARLIFIASHTDKKAAYDQLRWGRAVATKYNDIKTIIRSYLEEAQFLKMEKKYLECIEISKTAVQLASNSNQFVLENRTIKDIIELSNQRPDVIDSAAKIELIKRRKDIYKKLVRFSRLSIDIVQQGHSLFSKDKLIDMYGIVLNDFEKISDELSKIIEILNIEIDRINQKYIAYLNTEIKGFTYKSILHKFKNDLPNETQIDQLKRMSESVQPTHLEEKEILMNVSRQLESFATVISHIKDSANETLKISQHEKKWCLLDTLVKTGIGNFIFYKPAYKEIIKYSSAGQDIEILVQNTLFESTISEILDNAFDYAETAMDENHMEDQFKFYIDIRISETRFVILEFYARYGNGLDEKAAKSIKDGLNGRTAEKRGSSQFGFYTIRFLFEDLLGGQVTIPEDRERAGICISLPIDGVTCK